MNEGWISFWNLLFKLVSGLIDRLHINYFFCSLTIQTFTKPKSVTAVATVFRCWSSISLYSVCAIKIPLTKVGLPHCVSAGATMRPMRPMKCPLQCRSEGWFELHGMHHVHQMRYYSERKRSSACRSNTAPLFLIQTSSPLFSSFFCSVFSFCHLRSFTFISACLPFSPSSPSSLSSPVRSRVHKPFSKAWSKAVFVWQHSHDQCSSSSTLNHNMLCSGG